MTLAALILAGGLSQRMGQDKALLELEGTSLLRRTWDVVQTLTSSIWIVTSRPEPYRSLLPATAQWILEKPPEMGKATPGPLLAFVEALNRVEADWVLLLPCDLPALRAKVLGRWRQALPHVASDAIAYLPQSSKGWEPLCGFYRDRSLPKLQAYVAAGGRSFQQWLAQETVQAIPDVPADMLVNCNTPEDWAHYRDRFIQST